MAKDLAQRVGQQAAARREQNGGGELAERDAEKSLRTQITNMQAQFQLAMPRGAEAQQLVRDSMTLMRSTRNLARCTQASVLGGLMTFAQLGLRPGVLGHAWLSPFRDWKSGDWQAQIVIGYKGYAELVHRSGEIKTLVGRAIHENDSFELEYGIEDRLVHKPAMSGPRGKVVGYYAIIKYRSGGYVFWHMTRDEAIEWRNKHAMSAKTDKKTGVVTGSGPWFDETGPDGGSGFDQMAIKTCFLRAQRWAPKGTDLTLARATEVDGGVRLDTDLNPDALLNVSQPEAETVDGEIVDDTGAVDVTGQDLDQMGRQAEMDLADAAEAADPPAEEAKPATQAQHRAIMRLLGKHVTSDEHRHAVYSAILGRPVASGKDLTTVTASTVLDQITNWEKAGELGQRVGAMAPAQEAAEEASAPEKGAGADEGLPDPDSDPEAWHEAGHPRRQPNGTVSRVPVMGGDVCEYCPGEE